MMLFCKKKIMNTMKYRAHNLFVYKDIYTKHTIGKLKRAVPNKYFFLFVFYVFIIGLLFYTAKLFITYHACLVSFSPQFTD